MRVRILGKYWNLIFKPLGRHKMDGESVHGLCDPVVAKNKEIWVDSKLSGQDKLESIVHEVIHAGDQCQVGFVHSEDYVTSLAHDIAKILWKLKYRQVSSED